MAAESHALRILTFTSVYPTPERPAWGVFVETRLRELLDRPENSAEVVSPVPWFPFKSPVFGAYAASARTPRRARLRHINVHYPRYLTLPVLARPVTGVLMALGALPALRSIRARGFDFEVIDAHFLYPDGVAAVILGALMRRPVVITGRGHDINWAPRRPIPRQLMRWAALRADGVITVCEALKRDLVALGVPGRSVTVLRNGVDPYVFAPPADRRVARARLGLDGPTLISVGHLIERKGHDLVIEALLGLPDHELVIIGDGPKERSLRALAARLGVAGRTRFVGALPPEAVPAWYGAADALVLASSREGWANVLLEAMACGTPAIASDVGGTREALGTDGPGLLLTERSASAIAEAVRTLQKRPEARHEARVHARQFTWDEVTEGVERMLGRAAAKTPVRTRRTRLVTRGVRGGPSGS